MNRLEAMVTGADQRRRVLGLRQKAVAYLDYAKRTIELRRERGLPAAAERVGQGEGRREMIEILTIADELEKEERGRLAEQVAQREASALRSVQMLFGFAGTSVVLLVLTFAGLRRDIVARRRVERQLANSHLALEERLRELEERTQEMQSLNEFGDALLICMNTEEAHATMAATAQRLFPGGGGLITVLGPAREMAEIVQHWGEIPAENFEPDACMALRTGRFYFTGPDTTRQPCRHLGGWQGHAVCIPLVAHGEALGTVHLALTEEQSQLFRKKRVLFEAMAEQAAITVSNLQLRETLRQQSIRDPLTGLFNRRYMEVTLERELRRSIRTGKPLGLMMLDIDHFKRFNDTHGHDAGDLLLVEVAKALQRAMRAEDVVCRFGGEEFSIILPDADLQAAHRRAEALLQIVRTLRPARDGRELGHVTVSVGVACSPQHGADPAVLLRAADQALYAAKAAGRNRAELAVSGELSATI